MTTLNSRLQLALLNRKKSRNLLEKGFTLVELMIVIVIVGILSAVALPNFLGTKDRAEVGAMTGSLVGLAKECATNAILDSTAAVSADGATGITFIEGGDTGTICKEGGKMSNTKAYTAADIKDAKCQEDVADGTTDTFCVFTIGDDGDVSGEWGSAVAS